LKIQTKQHFYVISCLALFKAGSELLSQKKFGMAVIKIEISAKVWLLAR
jgi:hypothetical protein